jgi:hypothetical protein
LPDCFFQRDLQLLLQQEEVEKERKRKEEARKGEDEKRLRNANLLRKQAVLLELLEKKKKGTDEGEVEAVKKAEKEDTKQAAEDEKKEEEATKAPTPSGSTFPLPLFTVPVLRREIAEGEARTAALKKEQAQRLFLQRLRRMTDRPHETPKFLLPLINMDDKSDPPHAEGRGDASGERWSAQPESVTHVKPLDDTASTAQPESVTHSREDLTSLHSQEEVTSPHLEEVTSPHLRKVMRNKKKDPKLLADALCASEEDGREALRLIRIQGFEARKKWRETHDERDLAIYFALAEKAQRISQKLEQNHQ